MKSISEFRPHYLNANEVQYLLQQGYAILDQQNLHIKIRRVLSEPDLSKKQNIIQYKTPYILMIWKTQKKDTVNI
jgi:hypothetical protein